MVEKVENIISIEPGEEHKHAKNNDENAEISGEINQETSENGNEGAEAGQIADTKSEETESVLDEDKTLDELPLPGEPEVKEKEKALPKWVEKKLSRKDAEAQRLAHEAALLKQQLEEMKASSVVAQPPSLDPTMPKRDDFEDEGHFVAAIVEHQNKKAVIAKQKEEQEQAAIQGELQFRKKLEESVTAGMEKYEDFSEKVAPLFNASFPVNRAFAEAIVDSPYKQDILYFLGQYPEKAKEIALLNPIQAVKRVAAIESRFEAAKKPSQTKTPAPIESVGMAGGAKFSVDSLETLSKNAAQMSQADFEAAVKKINAKNKSPWS